MLVQLHLCTWIMLHIFEQRIGFEHQIPVWGKTCWVYMFKIIMYFKSSMLLRQLIFFNRQISFIHHGRMTSYDLCRQIIHTHSKSRPYVLYTRCKFLYFFPFNETIIIVQNWLIKLQCKLCWTWPWGSVDFPFTIS